MILLPLLWLGNSSNLGYLIKAWLNCFKFITVYFSFLFLLSAIWCLVPESRALWSFPSSLPTPQSVGKNPIRVVVFYQRPVRPVGPTPAPHGDGGGGKWEWGASEGLPHILHVSGLFTIPDQSQAQQGLLYPLILRHLVPWLWFCWIVGRDNGSLLHSFMDVTN